MSYTPDPRLVLKDPPSTSGRLVFGERPAVPPVALQLAARLPRLRVGMALQRPDTTLQAAVRLPKLRIGVVASGVNSLKLQARLPRLRVGAKLGAPREAQVSVRLPKLRLGIMSDYDINVLRPLVANARGQFQQGALGSAEARGQFQQGARVSPGPTLGLTMGVHVSALAAGVAEGAVRVRSEALGRHEDAQQMRQGSSVAQQDGLRLRAGGGLRHEDAQPLRAYRRTGHDDRLRHLRPFVHGAFQQAAPARQGAATAVRSGRPVRVGRLVPNQQARKPPAGIWVWPTKPPVDPCYLPDPRLVFKALADGSTRLVFICERHRPTPPGTVVVPTLLEYIVTNNVTLLRLSDERALPLDAATLRLDADSWTWGADMALPGYVRPYLERGEAYELTVNGTAFRLVLDKWSQTRTFGSASIKASARGLSAELADPFAPVLNFGVPTLLTAQQVAYNCLTDNGVPIGWDLDWQLTDWDVPAGVWAMQGTYIQALQQIAQAAGGYLQPHNTLRTVHVLPRYPTAPWAWGDVTPDFALPESVVSVEGTEWLERPAYNAVVVQGERGGIRGMVKRAGTAGDFHAPMVTDKLITAIAAARQRGIAVLGEGGLRSDVRLRMPVLPETGIIKPGKFVSYQGATGLVRSVAVEAGFPEVWQTVGVEFRG